MHIAQFLTNEGVWFEMITHRPAFTALTNARSLHFPADHVAKSILLRGDAQFVLAVIPASQSLDLPAVRSLTKSADLSLAPESVLTTCFCDCELGAVPPFGSHYGMMTLLDESFPKDGDIVFEGNRLAEAFRMRYQDFVRIEQPLVGHIARERERAATGADRPMHLDS